MSARDEEDLAARVGELEDALRDLQREYTRKGPRIPSPGDLLRFTDRHAIPFTIAVLEAQIQALKALRGLIRLTGVSGREIEKEGSFERVSRTALDRLDSLVAELRATPMPQHPEARGVLEQAETLRDDLAARLEEAEDAPADENAVTIDVEQELESIKSDMNHDEEDGDEEDEDDQSTGSNR